MTRKEALEALLSKVEAGETPEAHEIVAALGENYDEGIACVSLVRWACDASDIRAEGAAKALVKATLPGWGYRVCECYLTDDAAVFPDFNCPEHGPRLRAQLDESVDWFDLTDVAQEPAGEPARALLRSVLIALIAQEGDT